MKVRELCEASSLDQLLAAQKYLTNMIDQILPGHLVKSKPSEEEILVAARSLAKRGIVLGQDGKLLLPALRDALNTLVAPHIKQNPTEARITPQLIDEFLENAGYFTGGSVIKKVVSVRKPSNNDGSSFAVVTVDYKNDGSFDTPQDALNQKVYLTFDLENGKIRAEM